MKKQIIFLVTLFIAVSFTSCDKNSAIVIFNKKIKYEVSGSAAHYMIRYYDENGNYLEIEEEGVWSYEFKGRSNRYLYLSATKINPSGDGDVKVEVFVKDKSLLKDGSNAPNGIATVSGHLN
ncbi:MAG: hypothetical protein CVT98_10250 [Bacteroidetes bacterium HGW-Bacteroidetes-15]|nr:MAG: hypothetical protein CVT98_10250 [Bacteroidetes bacterium HGW-Bacteroidetes-15]